MNDDELSTVLYLVNRGRVALGKLALRTLPKGSPETQDCVVGRALNLGVEYMTFGGKREYYVRCRDSELATKLAQVWRATPRWLGDSWAVDAPEALNEFISAFDSGNVQALIRVPAVKAARLAA
jgi:hypothetical protein